MTLREEQGIKSIEDLMTHAKLSKTIIESSSVVRERVMATRCRQWARLGPAKTNAEMTAKETKEFGGLTLLSMYPLFLMSFYQRAFCFVLEGKWDKG